LGDFQRALQDPRLADPGLGQRDVRLLLSGAGGQHRIERTRRAEESAARSGEAGLDESDVGIVLQGQADRLREIQTGVNRRGQGVGGARGDERAQAEHLEEQPSFRPHSTLR
jgi:hypothetical protein